MPMEILPHPPRMLTDTVGSRGPVGLQGMSNTHPGEYQIPLYTQVCSPSGRPQVIAG